MILIVGGDSVEAIWQRFGIDGAQTIEHWSGRRPRDLQRSLSKEQRRSWSCWIGSVMRWPGKSGPVPAAEGFRLCSWGENGCPVLGVVLDYRPRAIRPKFKRRRV